MTAYMDHKDLANRTIDAARAGQIRDGVHAVLDRIAKAEAAAGRAEGSVTLLAATKTRDVGEIMAAIDAGVRLIGENRPQEVEVKATPLSEECAAHGFALAPKVADSSVADSRVAGSQGVGFHLIGQLQANKINKVLGVVETIESVDSLKLAQRISTRAVAHGLVAGVFVEVNESGEESKSGCDPAAAFDLVHEIDQLDGVHVQGLMTIGAHVDDEARIRQGFAHLRQLRDSLQADVPTCTQLSMGMTNDLEYAVAEGSTIVRVGTAIFGPRAFI
ncbi:MAG: YggS family pyridoxal phosphate-dependent enzyme [Bifidobacteriaceae bacterium]|nr:YggS family pyridoxal phosphate-dependent enzyme [Bifidobacteriaceae bacterium]